MLLDEFDQKGQQAVTDAYWANLIKPYANVIAAAPEGPEYGESLAMSSRFGFMKPQVRAILANLKDRLDPDTFEESVKKNTRYDEALSTLEAPVQAALEQLNGASLMTSAGVEGDADKLTPQYRAQLYALAKQRQELSDALK